AIDMLNGLMGKVPSLKSMEVGSNFADEARAMDLVITTTFDSIEDLQAYAIHPKHLNVVEFIKATTEYSKVVDYEK
ncbi:MAG: Dabb family protein, partial [Campylobacterota bacterium]|nr:Dabb family protein [Campylobacterota bacterium]